MATRRNKHETRRANTRRRFGFLGTVIYAAAVAAQVREAAAAAGEVLTPDEERKRVQAALEANPLPPGVLGPDEVAAEIETLRVGQRRSGNRKPASEWDKSNDSLIARLQRYLFPDLLTAAQLTTRRLKKIQEWLRVKDSHPRSYTDAALKKLIQRARRDARQK